MSATTDPTQTLKLAQEQLDVRKREVVRGRVEVRTHVQERDEHVEALLRQEDVTVERVPRGIPVDVAPAVREEDGVLIVPVLEEQLFIQTRLILKEELHITRTSREETVHQVVRLKSEQAVVTRLEGSGQEHPERNEGTLR